MEKTMFHTQENRRAKLTFPMLCNRTNAWFGEAYYFWADLKDAIHWGETSKDNNYDIYQAEIVTDKVLDTVFHEEHYNFLLRCLEKVANKCIQKTGRKPTKAHICNYFNNQANWKDEIDVLLACDYPCSSSELFPGFQFRKRIQAAVYNDSVIHDFRLNS